MISVCGAAVSARSGVLPPFCKAALLVGVCGRWQFHLGLETRFTIMQTNLARMVSITTVANGSDRTLACVVARSWSSMP